MISRSVVWGWLLCLVRVGQPIQYVPQGHLAPPPAAAGPGDCALILGNDRTSLYDYGTNLLRGTLDIEGSAPCITYDAINQAYIEARKRIHVQVPPVERMWKTDEIAKVGELLLDITAQLAKTYGLSVEDIETGLPQIDMSKTLIQEVCPPYLSSVECHAGKYRRLDGLCNNINNPSWGATMTPFTRLVPPQFADGLNAPRSSVLGHNLPLPRVVSRTMHPDDGFHDHAGTVMVVAWGQFMDHDFTLTATPLDPVNKNDPEECCERPPHQKHPYCLEIIIPDDDYFFKGYKVKCMDFVRSFPSVRPGCRLGSKVPYNTLTGVIDGNTVYGVDDEFGRHLRSGYGGELRMNPVFAEYGLKDLLPLKLDVPDEGCTRTNSSQFCFESGEIRVNEQLVLTCMHTLMAREHNRMARGLAEINPHWDDETLYQEARRIVIAEIQHITFNEFLPIILGKDVMEKFGLMLQKEGYWDGYDPMVNPNIIAAFSAAAFRFGHSLLPTAVERWSKAHKFISSKRLSDLIRRPYDLYRAGVMDEYLMGLMNQVAQAMDDSITQEVTNHLLKKPGNRFGLDLVAFNMQRGREFGVPGYMQYRKFCGLPTADSFEELFGSMPNSTVYRYSSIFDHPNDIDLWSGGVSERPLPGSMLGPTFACIIATQLSFIRRGDRFWYELPNQPSSFTPEQLQEIRKVKLSRVLCDNTDLIDTIQIYPMVLPDHQINPRVPCKAGIIPSLDLTKWAEFPNPAHYNISKPSQPQSSVEEIVVVCNGTAGCSVPGLDSLVDNTISSLDSFIKGAEAEKPGSSKIIDIVAESPVLYIQRLKRWFQEQSRLGNQTARTRRTKRETLVNIPYRRSLKAEGGIDDYNSSMVRVSNIIVPPRLQNVSGLLYIYPENKLSGNRKKRNVIQLELPEGVSKKVKISFLNNYDAEKTSVTENDLSPRNSRSDGGIEESQSDFKKTKHVIKIPPHLSTFTGPVNLPSHRRWGDDSGFNQQLLLGGSVRDYSTGNQNDPTNNFQILDADHDYDNEYEFVKINKHETDGPEEEESRDSSGGSNDSRQSYEGERSGEEGSREGSREGSSGSGEEGSREGEEEEDNAGERENSEEEEDVEKTKIVVLQPTAPKVPPSFQLGLSDEDIQARYITKDPLAGPGATRGFNHDFKAARGVPVQGGVAVLPNTRYPTIPGFNTKQIHNILTSGKLPGTVGVGPNGTTIGIVPIEPARHARPNNLGQYLEEIHPPLMSPGRGVHPRRPVGRIRIKSQIYKGMPRRPVYSMGPTRGQQLVYVNRPPRYRQPVRGGTHLSYPGRGSPANMYRSRTSGRPMMIIKRVERSGFEKQAEDYVGDDYISNPMIGYSSRGRDNKPPDNYNQEIVSRPKPLPSNIDNTKTKPFIEDDEYKRNQNIKIKNNLPNWSFSKIEQNEDGSENVHDTESTPNEYFRDINEEEELRDNNEEENTDENNPNTNKKIKNNLPNWSLSKIGQNENGNENVHDTENSSNKYRIRKGDKENLRNNNEEENADEDNLQEDDIKGKAISDVPLTSRPEETVEKSKFINEQDDLQTSIAKIMQRTKELENEKLTKDGEQPVAYNKYWSLEYSYPT